MAFPLAALAGAAASMGGSGGSMAGAAGGAAAALTGLSAASGGLSEKFTAIVNTASRFVQAFDPAIVAELNRAFRDLDAVIGTALRPVVASAINIVRSFGGAIYGAMQQLAPIVEKVATTIANTLQPVFDNFGTILGALMPLFDALAEVVAGVLGVFGDIARALRPFIEMILELGRQLLGSLFGADVEGQIKGLFQQVRDAVQMFVKNLLIAVAALLKMVGATQTLDALIRGVRPAAVKDISGAAAPQNAAFASLADVGRNLTLAAFTASAAGGAEKKKPEDFLAGIEGELQKIAGGDMSSLPKQAEEILIMLTKIKEAIEVAYKQLPEKEKVFAGTQIAASTAFGPTAGAAVMALQSLLPSRGK